MEIKDIIVISEEFYKDPGARYNYEGKHSGEDFLSKLLLPRFEKAVSGDYILEINLNNVFGYPSSFVSGSFGKLSLDKGADIVLSHIKFISNSKLRVEKIIAEIKNPTKKAEKSK